MESKTLEPVLNERKPSGRHSIPVNERPGAYILMHISTGGIYIGSTGNLGARISRHVNRLRANKHENRKLQEAFNKDPDLQWSVSITKDREEAYDLEQKLLDHYADYPHLFNLSTADVRNPAKGIVWSEESRKKLRLAQIGKVQTPESNERRSKALKGKPKPEGFGERLREANLNHPRRAELNKALSNSRRGGDNPNSKAVTIDGVTYSSGSDAARALNIPRSTLEKRLKSNKPKYASYQMGISE